MQALVSQILFVIPWLWPFAPGPSASVAPWLAGAAVVAMLALMRSAGASRALVLALVVFLPLSSWHTESALEPAALSGALLLMAVAAGTSRSLLMQNELEQVARAWWLAAAISTAIALAQYFALSSSLSPWVSSSDAGIAYANLRQRNQFASLTALGLAALLWEVRRGARITWVVPVAAFIGLGNAASLSRTGLVEFIAMAALVMLWPGRSRRQGHVLVSALAAYVVGVVILPPLLSMATGLPPESLWQRVSNPDSCAGRAVLWSNVLHLIGQRPWLGWGWGELDYGHYMTLYPGARFCDILDNAHNLPLHIAVEFGVPVALIVVGLLAWAVLRARPWREANTNRQLAWAALAVIGIHSMLEYPLWYAPFQMACGLAIGMLWPDDVMGAQHRRMRFVAPVVLALGVAYAAWDYTRVTQIYLAPEERLAGYRDDPMSRIRGSWLFREQARFAELTLTPLTRANARWTFELATDMLHYSPEPRVIEKITESALMLRRDDVVAQQLPRFRAAFPKEHAQWLSERGAVKD
jgi:O-antigen ligase